MIPFVAPAVWPERVRQGRFASTIVLNAPELEEDKVARGLLKKCKVALLGIPDDTGVLLNHGRPGARLGPHALRSALAKYGVAAPLDEPADRPAFPRVFDAGDIIPGESIHETHDRVSEATQALLELGMFPIAIGGGHDLTFAFVRGCAKVFGPMEGVYLDAHLDVRPEVGSGMSFRSLLENNFATRIHALGIDSFSNTREHAEYLRAKGGSINAFTPEQWKNSLQSNRCFVSLDMDVLDMAHAPGVSAMNPNGWSPAEAARYLVEAGKDPRVCCMDIMEINPTCDEGGRTSRLASHLLLTFLRAFAERPAQ